MWHSIIEKNQKDIVVLLKQVEDISSNGSLKYSVKLFSLSVFLLQNFFSYLTLTPIILKIIYNFFFSGKGLIEKYHFKILIYTFFFPHCNVSEIMCHINGVLLLGIWQSWHIGLNNMKLPILNCFRPTKTEILYNHSQPICKLYYFCSSCHHLNYVRHIIVTTYFEFAASQNVLKIYYIHHWNER